MGITTIDQVLKMGIVEEILVDFLRDLRTLSDGSFETLSELSDSTSDSSKAIKLAKLFPSELGEVGIWALRLREAQRYYRSRRNAANRRATMIAHRRVWNAEIELESAMEKFIQKAARKS